MHKQIGCIFLKYHWRTLNSPLPRGGTDLIHCIQANQSDIHEYQIMEDFCLSFEDRRLGEQLRGLIKGSGAFRRFKNAIHERGIEKDWYQFRQTEFERIAIKWLEQQGVPHTREEETEVLDKEM